MYSPNSAGICKHIMHTGTEKYIHIYIYMCMCVGCMGLLCKNRVCH